jgi:hypothetical protein
MKRTKVLERGQRTPKKEEKKFKRGRRTHLHGWVLFCILSGQDRGFLGKDRGCTQERRKDIQ